METALQAAVLRAVRDYPEIAGAAVTGSLAREAGDAYSDLDLLLVARDAARVRDVRSWLPGPEAILIAEFHLAHYCTVLLEGFEKIDLAIFGMGDDPAGWVVHDYRLVKGGREFEAQLAAAAVRARTVRDAHGSPDVSMDNVLLLLWTGSLRVRRGEPLSGHAFLGMAADMLIALEARRRGVDPAADVLDPRRRLERIRPELAAWLQECLFGAPAAGIARLAAYLRKDRADEMTSGQGAVLERLLDLHRASDDKMDSASSARPAGTNR